MERSFPKFDERKFAAVAASFDRAIVLGAELVLRTDEWRAKYGLSAFSEDAIRERRTFEQLGREFEQLPRQPQWTDIMVLIDRYSAVVETH